MSGLRLRDLSKATKRIRKVQGLALHLVQKGFAGSVLSVPQPSCHCRDGSVSQAAHHSFSERPEFLCHHGSPPPTPNGFFLQVRSCVTFLVPTASMTKCRSGDESAREGSYGGVSWGWLVCRRRRGGAGSTREGSLGIPDLPLLLLQTPKAVLSLGFPQRPWLGRLRKKGLWKSEEPGKEPA